jgi:hypothetical protein
LLPRPLPPVCSSVEAADVLYGVAMEEPGLSRIVSVNLA